MLKSASNVSSHIRASKPFSDYSSTPPFLRACNHAQRSFPTTSGSVIAIIENLFVPMCGIHDGFDGVEICFAQPRSAIHYFRERLQSLWRKVGKTIPMLLPKSVAWNTLTLKSCCTLPTTSAALLSWRCASYGICQPLSPFAYTL